MKFYRIKSIKKKGCTGELGGEDKMGKPIRRWDRELCEGYHKETWEARKEYVMGI